MPNKIKSNNEYSDVKLIRDFDNDGSLNDIHAGMADKVNSKYLGEGLENVNELDSNGKVVTYLSLKKASNVSFGGVKLSEDFILDKDGKIKLNINSPSLFSEASNKANTDGDGNVITKSAVYFKGIKSFLSINRVTNDINVNIGNRTIKLLTDKNISLSKLDANTLNGKDGSYYRCDNNCSWTCSTTCTDGCGTSCTGLCSTTCTGTCLNGCTDTCTGSCKENCQAACTTTCTGSCTDSCEGTCVSCTGCSGTCSESCSDGCKNTCQAQCLNTCISACQNSCVLTCSDNCFTSCSSACRNDCSGGCLGA